MSSADDDYDDSCDDGDLEVDWQKIGIVSSSDRNPNHVLMPL